MTTARSIACGSCGSDVPYGRLSCPSCGDLLASVAGGTRRATSPAGTAAAGPATFASSGAGSVTDAAPVAARSGGERVTPSVLHEALEPASSPSDAPTADESGGLELLTNDVAAEAPAGSDAPPADESGGLDLDEESGGNERVADEPVGVADASGGVESSDAAPALAPTLTGVTAAAWPPAPAAHDVAPIVDGAWAPTAAYVPTAAYAPPPAGAYVPPSAGMATSGMAAAMVMPGGPAAPARSWAGYGNGAAGSDGAEVAAAAGASDAASARGRIEEFTGWLAIAGGALAAVGFLLPWGVSIIGARGVDYFGRWGVAGPFHVVVVLAVVAVVVLAIVPNRIPTWIRIGLAGTILGVFLLGLVWPYVFGLSSTGPGAYAVGVGALALLAAGITSLATDRHGRAAPPV